MSVLNDKYREVIFLTHVPPFKEACWHEGKISDDDFLPYFASQAMGAALYDITDTNPDKTLSILCGHTHTQVEAKILANLTVKTGGDEYGRPNCR